MAVTKARRAPTTHWSVRNSETLASVCTPRCKMQLAASGANNLWTAAPGRIQDRWVPNEFPGKRSRVSATRDGSAECLI